MTSINIPMDLHSKAFTRLLGRPLAMAPRALDAFLAARFVPQAGGLGIGPPKGDGAGSLRGYVVAGGGIAVVPIIGPLLSRGDWLTEMFGIMSYADVSDAIETAFADPNVNAVLLEVDSPGGEVGGLFDLVGQIREARNSTGKPLWAVASESALSAGYAIASAADQLYVTQTGETGSIGVVAAHVDESVADAMAGQKWTLIQGGAKKTEGNPHQPLSSQAFADIQADVDVLYAQFVALVAENRGISADAVIATEAAIYRGQRAIAVGLADRVGTMTSAIVELGLELEKRRTAAARTTRVLSSHPRSPVMTTTELPADAPETASTVPATGPAPVTAPVPTPASPAPAAPAESHADADALRAEYSEIAAIAAQAARLGVGIDAADAMKKGIKPDALRRSVLDALAARTEASTILAAAPPQPSPRASPIVRRARERAAAGKH